MELIVDETKVLFRVYAMSFLGLPYKWGGDDPIGGFDCSGFVVEMLKSIGLLRREDDYTADGLWGLYSEFPVYTAEFGSLAFYGRNKISHVGLCLNDKILMEFGGGDSTVKTEEDAEQKNACGRIRPIHTRSDLKCMCTPPYPWKV